MWWLPSHLPDDLHKERKIPIPNWAQHHHMLGNQHADRLALQAAKAYELDPEAIKPIVKITYDTKLILMCLATVVVNLSHRKQDAVPKPGPRLSESLSAFALTSEEVEKGLLHCLNYRHRYSKLVPGVRRSLRECANPWSVLTLQSQAQYLSTE